jgi:hypothetical protein
LRGGGPGIFGVVTSATYRSFADQTSAGIVLNINTTHTNDTELFWSGVKAFHKYSNRFVDNGLYVYYELGTAGQALRVHPAVGWGKNASEMDAIFAPFYADLKAMGLKYDAVTTQYTTFYDLYIDLFEDEVAGNSALTGGWMFGQQDVASNNDGIISAFRNVLDKGSFLVGHIWNAGHGVPSSDWNKTAMNPRFRSASDKVITIVPLAGNAPLADKAAAQKKLTFDIDDGLRKAGPNGAAYVNEVSLDTAAVDMIY